MDFEAIQQDFYQERTAVLEFEGRLSRQEAERQAQTMSEAHRMACEVRYVLTIHGSAARKAYLDLCEAKRGKAAADKLRDAVRAEWNRRVQD